MDQEIFIGSVRIGGIDPSLGHYRDDFRQCLEETIRNERFARLVGIIWLNFTRRDLKRDGALVNITLRWTITASLIVSMASSGETCTSTAKRRKPPTPSSSSTTSSGKR